MTPTAPSRWDATGERRSTASSGPTGTSPRSTRSTTSWVRRSSLRDEPVLTSAVGTRLQASAGARQEEGGPASAGGGRFDPHPSVIAIHDALTDGEPGTDVMLLLRVKAPEQIERFLGVRAVRKPHPGVGHTDHEAVFGPLAGDGDISCAVARSELDGVAEKLP